MDHHLIKPADIEALQALLAKIAQGREGARTATRISDTETRAGIDLPS